MGTKYTSQGNTGYNSSPPPDDGTTGADNKLTWAKHKTKLGDPIKTQAEAIETNLVDYVDWATLPKSAAYTTVLDDDNRVIECTSSPTITLGAPATMGSGYTVTVKCVSGTTTVNPGGNNIDGVATNRSLPAGASETYRVNAAASDWVFVSTKGVGADETATLTNKTLTSPVLNGTLSGTAFLDEDNMASNSAIAAASQQSIKAYADAVQAAATAAAPQWRFVESLALSGSSKEMAATFNSSTTSIRVMTDDADTTGVNIFFWVKGSTYTDYYTFTTDEPYKFNVEINKMNTTDNHWIMNGPVVDNAGLASHYLTPLTLDGTLSTLKFTASNTLSGTVDIWEYY